MNILIVTGRTGGHFFPAKAFAKAFQRQNPASQIHFVLSRRTSGDLFEEEIKQSKQIHYFPSFPWKGFLNPDLFRFLFSLGQAFWLSRKLLTDLRPSLVVGFGSYLSFPVLFCASLKRIPTLIHEQNLDLGKANRMLLPFVTQVAVSFSDTITNTVRPKYQSKCIHNGNLIREDLIQAAPSPLPPRGRGAGVRVRLLIVGGSQGATGLNQLVTGALAQLESSVRERFQVVHLTGPRDVVQVREEYERMGVNARVESFSNEMAKHYSESDLVISRGGAGTLFELSLFGVPAILVPYPHAGSHQYRNISVLVDAGCAVFIDERSAKPEDLANKLTELVESPQILDRMRERLKGFLKVDDGKGLTELAGAGMTKLREVQREIA